jgi:spermidine synthase
LKPWKVVGRAATGDGDELLLQERDGVWVIRVAGRELMSSRRHGSEEAMASAAAPSLGAQRPRVLIGGLGLGYTLRAVLERLPAQGRAVVVEISPAIVEWNRGPLAPLSQAALEDSRVEVQTAEVGRFVASGPTAFDAILLDVDNGPFALSRRDNQALYAPSGLAALRGALSPGGTLVVWSAGPDARFLARLREAGFEASQRRVSKDTLFVARRGL